MTKRKDLTVGEVTKEDLRLWMQRITIEKRKQNRQRQQEIKNRIELLKHKINYNGKGLRSL